MPRQSQVGGAESQQVQVEGDLNVTLSGVSAAEVVEIIHCELDRVRDELNEKAELAKQLAETRLGALETRLAEAFSSDPKLRDAYADPDFQFSLRDAARTAISNDDQHTEDLLVDLLVNRAEQGNESRVRLVTSRAIQAADKLSLDALRGMTANWALGALTPSTPGALSLFSTRENVGAGIIEMGLPTSSSWVQDIEALGLATVPTGITVSRKPYRQFVREQAGPYLVHGINPETSKGKLETVLSRFPSLASEIRAHDLKPEFLTLPGTTAEELLATLPVSEEERPPELAELIAEHGYGNQDPVASEAFEAKYDESVVLSRITEWWDKVPFIQFNVVGTAIAFVNARRYLTWTGVRTVGEFLALPTNTR
jgi:hypothetical protein